MKDDLEKANGTIRALTIRLLAAETLQDTQGSSQHPYQGGHDHDLECDTSEGTKTNEECFDTMDEQGGGDPPSYREIECWVELESKRRRAIDLKDGAHHLQSDEATEAISAELTTAERKDVTMSSILNNTHYPPYDTCINLVPDQDKSKDTIQLMEGHSVKNQEATPLHMVCSKGERLSLTLERVNQELP